MWPSVKVMAQVLLEGILQLWPEVQSNWRALFRIIQSIIKVQNQRHGITLKINVYNFWSCSLIKDSVCFSYTKRFSYLLLFSCTWVVQIYYQAVVVSILSVKQNCTTRWREEVKLSIIEKVLHLFSCFPVFFCFFFSLKLCPCPYSLMRLFSLARL